MIRISEQTLFADRFLLKRLLGRGGFSEVWLATDEMTGLDIAVKVYAPGQGMDSDGLKDFCKELSQVYNLNHTNLLKPQHVDSWEGMPYLVMTYCPKGSCHRMVGAMTEEQIWKLLHDVSSGLAYLHKLGIIHQDIKPDNILVDNAGNYVITDFGISVRSRSTLRKSMNVASGSGTTAYMGPERFSADPMPLKASDIWSLGATAYELLTGNAPFGEIGGGLQKGGADLPTIKQNISPELRTVLSKMLSLATWDRPTAEQLSKWTESPKKIDFAPNRPQPVNIPKPIPPSRSNKPNVTNNSGMQKGWLIGIAVAVVVLVVGGVVLFKYLNKQPNAPDPDKIRKVHMDLKRTCDSLLEKDSEFISSFVKDKSSSTDLELQLTKTDSKLQELKALEDSFDLKKKFYQDLRDRFEDQLTIGRDNFEKELDKYDEKRVNQSDEKYQTALKKKDVFDKYLPDASGVNK